MNDVTKSTFGLLALIAMIVSQPALAKKARCFTTDDGEYACEFKFTDKQGSFEASAPGKPTIILLVEEPGVAIGFTNFGTGRNVALPGQYIQQQSDKACWVNDETSARLCAW